MNWQPIETAPKDGTNILVFGYGDMTVVHWNIYGLYWNLSESGAYAENGEWQPTHWMPLPPPPATDK